MTNETINNSQKMEHLLSLDNRKLLSLSGISEVDSFDDKSVIACTDMGKLSIGGENLNIKKLNLEAGELEVEGKISSLIYNDCKLGKRKRSFFGLFEKTTDWYKR